MPSYTNFERVYGTTFTEVRANSNTDYIATSQTPSSFSSREESECNCPTCRDARESFQRARETQNCAFCDAETPFSNMGTYNVYGASNRRSNGSEYIRICRDCDRTMWCCNMCSNVYPSTQAYIEDTGGRKACADCAENLSTCDDCGAFESEGSPCRCYRNLIFSFDHRPHPRFHQMEDESADEHQLYMGVEVEVEATKREKFNIMLKKTLDVMNNGRQGFPEAYAKHDGSISYGFELVSHPMTLKYHKHTAKWKQALKTLERDGGRSHQTQTCGLHVHVSKNWFSTNRTEQRLACAKTIILFDRIWDELITFSRRDIDNLERWARKNKSSHPDAYMGAGNRVLLSIEADNNDGYRDRYQAINVTNEYTMEFRIFRGTLNYDTFMATLELCYLISLTAKNKSIAEITNTTWSEFVTKEILDENELPYLEKYLIDKELLTC